MPLSPPNPFPLVKRIPSGGGGRGISSLRCLSLSLRATAHARPLQTSCSWCSTRFDRASFNKFIPSTSRSTSEVKTAGVTQCQCQCQSLLVLSGFYCGTRSTSSTHRLFNPMLWNGSQACCATTCTPHAMSSNTHSAPMPQGSSRSTGCYEVRSGSKILRIRSLLRVLTTACPFITLPLLRPSWDLPLATHIPRTSSRSAGQ